MTGIPVSPELCGRIVYWMSLRRGDLAALCLTCKAFQREAEAKLYETLMLGDPNRAHIACSTIVAHERFGPFVHSFYLYQDSRRQTPPLPRLFWGTVQEALSRMVNLEFLFISDPSFTNTWILDPEKIKFQVREAKLRFTWDRHLVKFLESQKKLRLLQNFDGSEDHARLDMQPKALPALEIFDGPLMVAVQLVSCPLTHLQVVVDPEVAPQLISVLPRLAKVYRTLRGLNFIEMPDELVSKALSIVSTSCPNLRHIGVLPLPWHNRHRFYYPLLHMHHIRSIELDVSRWTPQPNTPAQRALASELRVYCPTIRCLLFWAGTSRFAWNLDGEDWHYRIDRNHPHYESAWCNA